MYTIIMGGEAFTLEVGMFLLGMALTQLTMIS